MECDSHQIAPFPRKTATKKFLGETTSLDDLPVFKGHVAARASFTYKNC